MNSANELLRQRVELLKVLMTQNPEPPFEWRHCYEMPNGKVHWALSDPTSEAEGKVSSFYMVLEANFERTMGGGTIATEPLPMLVVEALNALPDLIEFYEQHRPLTVDEDPEVRLLRGDSA